MRALLRARELLLRERDAGHLRAGNLGEIEREPAPAAADIEHLGAGFDPKLRGEVAPLGELCVVERLVRRLEIGAAILLVGIEEEFVEPAVEVVVMRDIAPRPGPRIELLHAPEQVAPEPRRQRPSRRGDVLLPQQDCQHVRDRALLDDERAVHIGFAQPELGIEQNRCAGLLRW